MAMFAIAFAIIAGATHAGGMRNPFLNDLRGFNVSCADVHAERADSLCAAIEVSLETRFGKPVEISAPGALPQAGGDKQFLNFVWIAISVSSNTDTATIEARYGSTLRMSGVSEQVDVEPVEVSACATPTEMAEAILTRTPFGGKKRD